MNIRELFSFLVDDYELTYKYQKFINCYGGNWIVETYSFYNNSGCFTISYLPQRNELEFYVAPQFSTEHKELCERIVDIFSIEPDIWEKYTKFVFCKHPFIWCNNPFFWCSNKKMLNVLAEVLRVHLAKHKGFFEIKV